MRLSKIRVYPIKKVVLKRTELLSWAVKFTAYFENIICSLPHGVRLNELHKVRDGVLAKNNPCNVDCGLVAYGSQCEYEGVVAGTNIYYLVRLISVHAVTVDLVIRCGWIRRHYR